MVYKFFDKKSSGGGAKNENMSNQELDKQFVRKLEKQKLYLFFKDNVCGADLADMKLISKYKKGYHFLLCIIDICSKYPI